MTDCWLLATLLHGEQILFIAIPVLIAVVAGGIWFFVWLIKKFHHWNYKQRSTFGVVALSALGAVGSAIVAMGPNTGAPEILPASEIPRLVNALPPYAPFSYSDLAFFRGKLYVTSNIGLIEIADGKPVQLYRVQRDYSVVSGPWVDTKNQLLWIQDDQTQELLQYDGTSWQRVQMPRPEKEYYSRGDVLQGTRMVHDGNTLWMHAGGSAWQWDQGKGQWVLFPSPRRTPTVEDANQAIGVLILGGQPALIVRHEGLAYLVRDDEEFKSDTVLLFSGEWRQIPMDEGLRFFAERWTTVSGVGYLCTRDGRIIKASKERVAEVLSPGKCEALAHSGDALLTSVEGQGIFEYTGEWRLRVAHPYGGGGEYWLHLAEGDGEIAVAVHPKPVAKRPTSPSSEIKFERNATAGLWLIRNNKAHEVKVVP